MRHGCDLSEAVVAGTASIVDITLRNRTFLVSTNDQAGFVVKLLGEEVPAPPWESLILASMSLRELLLQDTERATHAFQELGRQVGKIHAGGNADLDAGPQRPSPAGVLVELIDLTASVYPGLSMGDLELVKQLQRYPEFRIELERLDRDWVATTRIHGDLSLDNVLVQSGSPESSVTMVDWESAGAGDPCWDTGTVLGELAAFWVRSIPVAGGQAFDGLAAFPISDLRAASRAFWDEYAQVMDPGRSDALIRTLRFAGARLVQSAYEQTRELTTLTPQVTVLVQLGLNIMERPSSAAETIFGIMAGSAE